MITPTQLLHRANGFCRERHNQPQQPVLGGALAVQGQNGLTTP